ncbi:MAG TPA: hypothetical protein VF725_14395, partial [Ktedonobacterales bacterium]
MARALSDAQLWRPLPYTGTLGDMPPPAWAADFDPFAFAGNPLGKEIVFLHRASGSVPMDDLIQIHQPRSGHPFNNALLALSGVAAPNGGAPLNMRLTFTRRRLARQSLDRLLS